MKLSADVLLSAPSRINPDGRRELDLSYLRVGEIENMSITRDLYGAINLNGNNIRTLGNMPKLEQLKTLLLCNNNISRIDGTFAKNVSNLDTLALSSNSISQLSQLDMLSPLSHLEYVTLLDNPICEHENYRLYAIWVLPSVRILDFERVRDAERKKAQQLFGSWDNPTQLAVNLRSGGANGQASTAKEVSQKEQEALIEQLKNAKTMSEIQAIEAKLGILAG